MIGIIGGNGVCATNRLLSIVEETLTKNGAFRDSHHPELLIWQATKAPSRSMFLEGRGPSWIEDYVEIGKKLKVCGCTEILMCCNTAHYAIDTLENQVGIKFVNLLDLVAIKCKEAGVERIGMMCSDGLRKVALYEKRFQMYAPDIEFFYPNEEFQKLVTIGICNAKNKIRFVENTKEELHPYNCFMKVYQHLIFDKNVDCVVAGCTDICNVFCIPDTETCKYIDSLHVLADYIISRTNDNVVISK